MTCVSWSRCGHYILSGGGDRTLALSPAAGVPGAPRARAQPVWRSADLGASPTHASLLGRAPDRATAVASFATGAPVAVATVACSTATPLPTLPDPAAPTAPPAAGAPPVTAAALADPTRRVVYIGQARGIVLALDPSTRTVLDGVRVGVSGAGSAAAIAAAGPRVQTLALSPCGNLLLACCHDRVVRSVALAPPADFAAAAAAAPPAPRGGAAAAAAIADLAAAAAGRRTPGSFVAGESGDPSRIPLLTPAREFTQAVDRPAWRTACAAPGGAFVAAAAASRTDHLVFVFDGATSDLDRVLGGPAKDPAAAAAWHPRGAPLVSLGASTGALYVWSPAFRENWAAFAPGFVELTENEEYVEREDEFDVNPRTDGGPGPGGVRPPPAADDASDAAPGDVAALDAVPDDDDAASVTSDGVACLVRLPLDVWPDDVWPDDVWPDDVWPDNDKGGGGGSKRKRADGE